MLETKNENGEFNRDDGGKWVVLHWNHVPVGTLYLGAERSGNTVQTY